MADGNALEEIPSITEAVDGPCTGGIGGLAGTAVRRAYADPIDGVPRPLAAFSLSNPLIHDFKGLSFGGSGICQKSVV
jgi:hypothetical protein